MRKTVTDFCPEVGHPLTISATVREIRMAGVLAPSYDVTGYSCEYASEHGCKTRGEESLTCPIYQKAKAAYR